MADRRDSYYRQLVSEANVDEWFDDLETADRRIMSDLGLAGILTGLSVSQNSPTGLSVIVSAGTAYDQAGQRIRVPGAQTVDISEDYLGAATDVTVVGQARWVSIFAIFDRDLSDPRTDGAGNSIWYDRLESFAFKVVQGTQSLTPTKPALLSDAVLLCDVQIAHGDTAVTNSDLDFTRRQNLFVVSGAPLGLNHTSFAAAFGQILSVVNNHLTGATNQHGAADIIYSAGSGDFADGVTSLPSLTSVEDTLTTFVAYLAEKAANPSGADLIGCRQDASVSPTLPAGTINDRLVALRDAVNLRYGGSGQWADTSTLPAGTVEATIDAIVSGLAALGGSGGIAKLGAPAVSQSPTSLSANRLDVQIAALLTAINARARIASAETITAKYTFDLASAGTGLETAADTTADFNGPVQVDDITATGTNRYKVASRSITRVQTGLLLNGSTGALQPAFITVLAGEFAVQTFDRLPDGATMTGITVYHNRTDGGSLPATSRVTVTLRRRDVTTGTGTVVTGPTEDPESVLANYNAHHAITITGLSEVIDNEKYVYYLDFGGESGAGATSTILYACLVTYTVTEQDEAP